MRLCLTVWGRGTLCHVLGAIGRLAISVGNNTEGNCHDGGGCLQYMTHLLWTTFHFSLSLKTEACSFEVGGKFIEDLMDFCTGMLQCLW